MISRLSKAIYACDRWNGCELLRFPVHNIFFFDFKVVTEIYVRVLLNVNMLK